MESVKVKEFLSIETNRGYDYGSRSGDGYADGSGNGYGSGYAYGYAYASASGSGYGDGSGSSFGSASGSSFGSPSAYGNGPDSACDIKSYINKPVYYIDDIPTIIQSIRGNIAKCMMLKVDLTTAPCFVVKVGNSFAHGKTIKKAFLDAQVKHFNELPEDERLQAFVDAHEWGVEYPDKDFYDWHNKLTGSCAMGRDMFAKEYGLEKLDGKHTVEWFVDLTKDAYGGDIIRRIPSLYLHK